MTSRIIPSLSFQTRRIYTRTNTLHSIQSKPFSILMTQTFQPNNPTTTTTKTTSSSSSSSSLLLLPSTQSPLTIHKRMGHSVRVILLTDLQGTEGKGMKHEILTVKAGYARNYLLPQKKAIYATPKNRRRLGLSEESNEVEEKSMVKSFEGVDGLEENNEEVSIQVKEALKLRQYLRNKIVKIRRKVEPDGTLNPGMVDTKALRQKLSKQLKIDLDPKSEHVQIHPEPIGSFLELDNHIQEFVEDSMVDADPEKDDALQVKQVGDYVAKIVLAGGHLVPLKFTVMKR